MITTRTFAGYRSPVMLALLVACKASSQDAPAAQQDLTVSAAGDSPSAIARATPHHAHGPLGEPWRLPRGSFSFSGQASGTLEIAPVD